MKSIIKLSLSIILLSILITACKKNGTGGSATLVAFPQHHGKEIKGATVYVKFKSKELPSDPTSNYDLKIVGEENEEHVHIEGMLPGDYYLYAVGYDSTISQTVKGGLPVAIKRSEKDEEKDIYIPVTE